MKIPFSILRKMRYYKEMNVYRGGNFYTQFTLVMPWFLRNVVLTVQWNHAGTDRKEGTAKFLPTPELKELRTQLEDWVDMQNQAPFKVQTDNLITRIKNKASSSR